MKLSLSDVWTIGGTKVWRVGGAVVGLYYEDIWIWITGQFAAVTISKIKVAHKHLTLKGNI